MFCIRKFEENMDLSLIYLAVRNLIFQFNTLCPRKLVFSTENKQKLAFSDTPPPKSAYVIYEWSHSNSIGYFFIFLTQGPLQSNFVANIEDF